MTAAAYPAGVHLPLTEPLRIDDRLVIPGEELRWRFDTSGGPGGQHANRSATRVELSWDVAASAAVDDTQRQRLQERVGGTITVIASETRSQWRNRAMARRRLVEVVRRALAPVPERVPTRIPAGERMRRREAKRRRSDVKKQRRHPRDDGD